MIFLPFQNSKYKYLKKSNYMIKIPVKEGESIERALKRLKRKTDSTGIIKEVRRRKEFLKPSVLRRQQLIKARYVEQLRREANE